MNIELRKVRFNEKMSDETNCFSAEIWVDGKHLADVSNRGCGGSNDYDVVGLSHNQTNAEWEAFQKYCKDQPHEFEFEYEDQIVDALFSKWMEKDNARRAQAQLNRWCKTKTVYRLKGDKEGSWWSIKTPFSPAVEARLVAKYGDRLETIANKGVPA
jgi:hypothetical protein